MKTWFNLACEFIAGKRKSKPFTPVLEDLDTTTDVPDVLVRDPSTGEMRRQTIASMGGYTHWLYRVAGVNHVVMSGTIAELITDSPSLSLSRAVQTGGFKFTLKNSGAVPIAFRPNNNTHTIAMNIDILHKIHLTENTTINLIDLQAQASHTVLLYISASTSTFAPFRQITWKCNNDIIPSDCFHNSTSLNYVSGNNKFLVSITTHGSGNTNLAISFINIKS